MEEKFSQLMISGGITFSRTFLSLHLFQVSYDHSKFSLKDVARLASVSKRWADEIFLTIRTIDLGNLRLPNTEISPVLYRFRNLESLIFDSLFPRLKYACHFLTKLHRLQHLDVRFDRYVLDDPTLLCLSSLTYLNLAQSDKVTDKGLTNLTNLTALNLHANRMVKGSCFSYLTNLAYLSIWDNECLINGCLEPLTKLKEIVMIGNRSLSDVSLKNLTSITSLNLNGTQQVTDEGISRMVNLNSLSLSNNCMISDSCVRNFTNLTFLDIRWRNNVSIETITRLRNLREILVTNHTRRDSIIESPEIQQLVDLNIVNGGRSKKTVQKTFFKGDDLVRVELDT